MSKTRENLDSVRASRDGHEFHEAWVSRKSLGLLMPIDGFVGLAIEGFSPVDKGAAEDAGNEIADAVLYFGDEASFEHAHRIVVVQVKYSKASESSPFRAADAKKTIGKFAETYRAHKRKFGTEKTRGKLVFELVTNRPISDDLQGALLGRIAGAILTDAQKDQADQVEAACKLKGKDLIEFLRRLHFTGLGGDLRESKHKLALALADWSIARDPLARVRLNSIRELARDKANLAHQNRNVISRADVLTALELQDESDLLPCPASFPDVGRVVERSQLFQAVTRIPELEKPLLVHANGGVGKTVFMSSIASQLGETHEVVLFDCFGMGQYRAPGDARHQPRKGLVHIVNELACRGLCDPLLPGSDDGDDLVRVFRLRMDQAATTIRRGSSNRKLILLLDAIDNACEQARDRGESAFPKLLLASMTHGGAINGMKLVVSSRTHRRFAAVGDAVCEELELQSFTTQETGEFLSYHLDECSEEIIQVAQSRSRGNARVLEHLVSDGPVLLASSEIDKVVELDDLLRKRIEGALSEARKKGHQDTDINTFLAGLATLPPPVPLWEFAKTSGLDEGAITSFAADLSPLIEQTKHGFMFRDEPTETLIREQYCTDEESLRRIATKLFEMQATSSYAAITLPEFLQQLGDGERLFELAFDERIPASIKSAVSRQAIRHSRLRAAVAYAANRNEFDRLVPLLVELSTLASVDQRGINYILDNPDLTVFSGDTDSVRRLFELRTDWPGTRHARLAIAYGLEGDLSDAYHHAYRVIEWRKHWFGQDSEYQRDKTEPSLLDMVSIPFCHLIKGDGDAAARDISGWLDWYAFEVTESLIPLLRMGTSMGTIRNETVSAFLKSNSSGPGMLAAAVPFAESDAPLQQWLIGGLAKACEEKKIKLGEKQHSARESPVNRGLLRAASIALVHGMKAEAHTILSAAEISPPSLHVYMSNYWSAEVYTFLASQALLCIAAGEDVSERHLLPKELACIVADWSSELVGEKLKEALKSKLEKNCSPVDSKCREVNSITRETKSSGMQFLSVNLNYWLKIAVSFADCFDQLRGKGVGLAPLNDLWPELISWNGYQSGGVEAQRQRCEVFQRLLMLAFEALPSLGTADVSKYLDTIFAMETSNVPHAIQLVSILAVRPAFQILAGTTAMKTKVAIEKEDDVSRRASFFADLSRAISPASKNEAAEYFHRGLEQMDAIGSGDYEFVNELMQFASSLHGGELPDEDGHTLSNICELNLGEENKFNWGAYGMAMAKVSGLKGLAKLARWEDRGRITLDYTLLPYVRALIHCGKIDPVIATTLLRLSNPAELYVCGTEHLVESLKAQPIDGIDVITKELIRQYQQNNPSGFGAAAPRALAGLARSSLGEASGECIYLSALAEHIDLATHEFNDLSNWRNSPSVADQQRRQQAQIVADAQLNSLINASTPVNEFSISSAIDKLQSLTGWGAQRDFFEQIQAKVPYGDWVKYLGIIARQEQLKLHEKIRILSACKDSWSQASNAVPIFIRSCAEVIIRQNFEEFVSFGYLSNSDINSLSELSGVDRHSIILELIKQFARPDVEVPASVWLALATYINTMAESGVGQAALKRLLNAGSAKLASSVVDGPWNSGLYPNEDEVEAVAGLIWFALGSARAERRWMAAHSLRVVVRLGRSDVLDRVVSRFDKICSAPFQAPELPFFHLHAKLWLLIAMARIAIDDSKVIANHSFMLKRVALSTEDKHVLFKHFSTEALLVCSRSGLLQFNQVESNALLHVNESSRPLLETNSYRSGSFYKGRPEGVPKLAKDLYLDYDFSKLDVSSLGDVFAKANWETVDAMNHWVRKHDAEITRMSDQGARSLYRRSEHRGFSDEFHTYGEQLCWHALHAVAGDFLAEYPVVRGPYDQGSPWHEWLAGRFLTRKDGLWLADGTDQRPKETRVNLREVRDNKVGITGDPSKLQLLLGIDGVVGDWLVVDGDWKSIEGIDVHVSSALVSVAQGAEASLDLASKDPFQAYIPRVEVYEDADPSDELSHPPFIPWVVDNRTDGGIDKPDPFGTVEAAGRRTLSSALNTFAQLKSVDPYGRDWTNSSGALLMRSEVWCQETDRTDEGRSSGTRILCRQELIKSYLAENNASLVVLIVLRQYKPGFGDRSSEFKHTTAVVQVNESLEFVYYSGFTDELHGE
ncbi:ATP-binding protein [Pseudomonas chlororaphis]|uniref:ATP-binding protein n=1 Tax=Pseudomonas chlororaphis TaxID=587753 RepID=UPI0004B4C309|nr:ATP-binding protein [Pseudomonas chlororaphis]